MINTVDTSHEDMIVSAAPRPPPPGALPLSPAPRPAERSRRARRRAPGLNASVPGPVRVKRNARGAGGAQPGGRSRCPCAQVWLGADTCVGGGVSERLVNARTALKQPHFEPK